MRTIELLAGGGDAIDYACGLLRQKQKYIVELARYFSAGKIPSRKLARMSDEEIVQCLTAVHGIGRWTAEMFLIFVLNRPDAGRWTIWVFAKRSGRYNLPAPQAARLDRSSRTLATLSKHRDMVSLAQP